MKNKIRPMLQVSENESGSTCLAMISGYYHKWISLEHAAGCCDVNHDGCSLEDIRLGAEELGFDAKIKEMSAEALKQVSSPAIIQLSDDHYAVFSGFGKQNYILCDPNSGWKPMPEDAFQNTYQGLVLELKPSSAFVESGTRTDPLGVAGHILWSSGNKLFKYGVVFLILEALLFLITIISKFFSDNVLVGSTVANQKQFLVLYGILCLILLIVQVVDVRQFKQFTTDVTVKSDRIFIWKILNLPLSFYARRRPSDLLTRKDSNRDISRLMTTQICEILVRIAMIFVSMAAMLYYSLPVFLLVVVMAILSYYFLCIQTKRKEDKLHRLINLLTERDNCLYDGFSVLDTIQNAGAEYAYFRRYMDCNARASYADCDFLKIDYTIGEIPQVLSDLTKVLIVAAGVYGIYEHQMTYGTILVIQGIYSMIADPISYISQVGSDLFSMKYKIEKIEAVKQSCDEQRQEVPLKDEDYKLRGDIALQDVTFGYRHHRDPFISHLNLTIHAGEQIAIVGKSGCGKSTLKNLLTGQLEAWSGKICFDGKPKETIPREIFTGSVAMVDQSITLFADTIMNNIKMWDDSIEDFEVILAAKDAQIYEMIMEKPKGFETVLTQDGQNLSGGERQRLEIARALALEPTILILDEATSALDAIVEEKIGEAIRKRQITTIMVAHRLSAIRNCNRIFVMEDGAVIAQGTHEQLLKSCPLYLELITKE